MIIRPVYNLLLLPEVSYYFKRDFFEGWETEPFETGTEILFPILREEKESDKITPEDFYRYGVDGYVEKIGNDDTIQVRTQEKIAFDNINITDGIVHADIAVCEEIRDMTEEEEKEQFDAMRTTLLKFFQSYQWGFWARSYIMQRKGMNDLISAMADQLNLTSEDKYEILEADSLKDRYQVVSRVINEFIEIAKIAQEAENEQQDTQEQQYREAALKKQINYLQKELDDMHPENVSDIRKFEEKIAESGMNEEARKEADKVLNRMKQEGKEGHEYGMLYDYLDFLTSLSWKEPPVAAIDLDKAEEILDEDHYGLKKVKERIIQQLAVMELNKKQSGSILLFVGAPGTGKTSIGQSIARALGREYVRISLGGIRDEAEIRGHRRTYVGAMPGRIMEGMKRSGVSNPVMVLDEVDKLAKDYGGDPASALLEVLDPEQNNTFTDHYMNVPYDLSNVLFVCTANSTDTIPEPLLNRMEMIPFSGYTAVEKYQIAVKHLLPKALESNGISPDTLEVSEGALRKIIDDYTMEAGVRSLKNNLVTLCRSAAVTLVRNQGEKLVITEDNLEDYLGKKQMHHDLHLTESTPGVVTGLAWTTAGGEILFVETRLTEGDGKMLITGQLGDVMKESVHIALSLVKALYPEEAKKLKTHDLHVHVPAGAVPKDGPSAGITLTTALASLVTGKTADIETAMTGEVSLRGNVMPIGGLPEKLMAAQRAGIKRVFIPQENIDDLDEVADEVKEKLEIIPARKVTEVLDQVLAA